MKNNHSIARALRKYKQVWLECENSACFNQLPGVSGSMEWFAGDLLCYRKGIPCESVVSNSHDGQIFLGCFFLTWLKKLLGRKSIST